jgi:hypothetical protein
LENKHLFIGVAVLAVAVLLVPMIISKRNQPPAPAELTAPAPANAPAAAPPPPPEPEPPAKPVFDATVLDKLLYGMTYEQVVDIVGTDADESESQLERDKTGYTGPTLTVWKTWVNPDGSKLRVGFVESKLEQKQFKRRERDNGSERETEKP